MIGKTLAHYEITRLLGEGGMGKVYRARDTKLDRNIALKVISPELAADPVRLERFRREARTVAGLSHPHIVTLHSVEEDEGVHFLTMELVEGQGLEQILAEGRVPLSRVLDMGVAVADALAAAHEKGIVHRDLKPGNVMLTGDGWVKVLDFGLAKLMSPPGSHEDSATRVIAMTQEGSIVGTVPYMSPEQLRGREVDHRSDLFSFGVLLYELATGRRPFEGDNVADVTSSILKDEPPDVLEIRPDIPPSLDRLIGRCLAKDREGRFSSARAVADELRAIRRQIESGSSDVGSTRSDANARNGKTRSRARLIAATALLALAVAWVAWWRTSDPGSAPTASDERPIVAVLPFENLGGEEDEYFAAGITDEITSRLTLIQGLGVISRTSTRVYENTDKSIPEVGRELGSDYVLEGSIRWDKTHEPGRVRITPRLIRVADDTNLWSDNYERAVTEIFSLQSAIASRIAEALDITLLAPVRAGLDERPTQSIDAYQAYLRGMKQLRAPGFGEESFALGVQLLQRAVELDPQFAHAYARLSSMHSRMYHYGFDRSEQRLERARATAGRALTLRPDLAEAHLAMGFYHYWGSRDYERALEEFEGALEIEPNNSEVWLAMAYVKRRQGDFQSAIELLERDRQLSPLDPNVFVALGETYGMLRRYRDAEESLRRAIALAPDDTYPYTELAWVYLRWRGDTSAAREVLQSMPPAENSESSRIHLGIALLDREYDRALEVLASAPGAAFEAGAFFIPHDLARGLVHRLAGDESRARSAFEAARDLLENRIEENPEDHRYHSALGQAYAGLGLQDLALHHGQRAVEMHPLETDALSAPIEIVHLALIHTLLGQPEPALEQLRRALAIPSTFSAARLEKDPRWDPLRDHPGYSQLIERHAAASGN